MASTMQLIQPRYSRSHSPGVAPLTKIAYIPPNQSPVVAASSLNTEQPLWKEAASQTYGIGDLVYQDSAGQIAICTVTSTLLNSEILGVAMRAASGVTNAPVSVHCIRQNEVWLMNGYHATPASAVSALTQMQEIYGVIKINGKWHVDLNNTTTEDGTTALAYVRVIGFARQGLNSSGQFVDQDLVSFGDTYPLFEVEFLPWTMATDGSPSRRNLQIQ